MEEIIKLKNEKTSINTEIKSFNSKIKKLEKIKNKKVQETSKIIKGDSEEQILNNVGSIFFDDFEKTDDGIEYKLKNFDLSNLYKINEKYNFLNLSIINNGEYLYGKFNIYSDSDKKDSENSISDKSINENYKSENVKATGKEISSIDKKADKKMNKSLKEKEVFAEDYSNNKTEFKVEKEKNAEKYLNSKKSLYEKIFNSAYFLNSLKLNENSKKCKIDYYETTLGDSEHYIMIKPSDEDNENSSIVFDFYIPGKIKKISFEIYIFEESFHDLFIRNEDYIKNDINIETDRWNTVEFSDLEEIKEIIFTEVKKNTAFYIKNFRVEL